MRANRFTIIRIDPQEKPIFLVIEEVHEDAEVSSYMVEEGVCPKDLLKRNVQAIIIDGDTDPHGLFAHVRDIDRPEFLDRAHAPDEEWKKILPEAFP